MPSASSIKPPDGGTQSPPDVLSPTDRDRILQAMTECCAERGYKETSVNEVVARAGVDHETFEAQFKDKEDCALAALNKLASDTMTTASTVGFGDAPEMERALLGVKSVLELMAGRSSYASLGYIGARQGGTARMYDDYEATARVVTVMLERIRQIVGNKQASPTHAARAALGGVEALIRADIVAGRAGQLPRLLPDIVYGALVLFVGQEEALRQAGLATKLLAGED